MDRLSVVIPAYNEADSIAQVIERVLAMETELGQVGVPSLELIVVDDGSCDATAGIVENYANVKLICHEANRGYGAALKTGFSQAQGDFLAFLRKIVQTPGCNRMLARRPADPFDQTVASMELRRGKLNRRRCVALQHRLRVRRR